MAASFRSARGRFSFGDGPRPNESFLAHHDVPQQHGLTSIVFGQKAQAVCLSALVINGGVLSDSENRGPLHATPSPRRVILAG